MRSLTCLPDTRKPARSTHRKRTRLARLLRRFRQDRDGVAAIEFGIVAAPFFALLMGIFQVTVIYFAQSMMETGVAEAARMVRTGQVQGSGMTETDIRTLICSNVYAFIDCDNGLVVDVRNFPSFQDINVPDPLQPDGELNESTTFSPGAGSEVVVFRAFYAFDLPIPEGITGLSNMPGGRRLLAASASFRNEPF